MGTSCVFALYPPTCHAGGWPVDPPPFLPQSSSFFPITTPAPTAPSNPCPSITLSKPSYAAILKPPRSASPSTTPSEVRYFRKDGAPTIAFRDEDLGQTKKLLEKKAIMLNSFGRSMPKTSDIRLHIHREWCIKYNFSLGLLNPNYLLVSFDEEGHVDIALSRFNNYVMGIKFKVFGWYVGFDFTKDAKFTPMLVEVPNIGMGFMYEANLMSLGNDLGKWIATDRKIVGLAEPIVARFCAEVNIQEELPKQVWLESPKRKGYVQPLEYPLFSFCSQCHIKRHTSSNYKKRR